MPDAKSKNYGLRASIPSILLYIGLGGAVFALIAVAIGFFVAGSRPEFRGKDFPGELSENVVGVVDRYNRKQTEDGVLKYLVTADIAKTFDDNHQELDNISLKLFKAGDETRFDRILADRAVYLPVKDSNEFTVYFAGDVRINTSDELEVKTDQLSYRSRDETASAEEAVSFRRANISGTSFGALVDIARNTLELQKDVDIVALGGGGPDEVATLRAGSAFFEGDNEKVRLRDRVAISLTSGDKSNLQQPTDIRANSAEIDLVDREIRRIELTGDVLVKQLPVAGRPDSAEARAERAVAFVDRTIETLNLYGNVDLLSKRGNGAPVNAKGDTAVYIRASELYELTGNVRINTTRESLPLRAAAPKATYDRKAGVVQLSGSAEVSQGGETLRGETIRAELSRANRLKYAVAEGNALLEQSKAKRYSRVAGRNLRAWFSEDQQIARAAAIGGPLVEVFPADRSEYAKLSLSSLNGIDVDFNSDGFMKTMKTSGRTTIHMDAGSDRSAASEKTLTADRVTSVFRQNGNELATATAIGNAELVVKPLKDSAGVYRTRILAPRFDCAFYAGNSAKNCESTKRSMVMRKPVRGKRQVQKLEADKLLTEFERASRSVSRFEAVGNARFSEGDRKGIARRIEYLEANDLVRLRGGNPTLWDSRARVKAERIDWNTAEDTSNLAGSVSTTYFNVRQTGGAAPFADSDSPVYLTAETARFEHRNRSGVYIGDARAWQENNYVRGDKIYVEEQTGRFYAEGNVRSVLYEAEKTVGGRKSAEPVFVSATNMLYQNRERHLRYEKNVDMRQGTDRILASEADVYLDSDNALKTSEMKGNVVITQPNKKATGNYARYDAGTETVLLRGKPAVYSDDEAGSSSSNVMTLDLKNNRVVSSGSSSVTGTGRIRSVYKVKKGRLN